MSAMTERVASDCLYLSDGKAWVIVQLGRDVDDFPIVLVAELIDGFYHTITDYVIPITRDVVMTGQYPA